MNKRAAAHAVHCAVEVAPRTCFELFDRATAVSMEPS